MVVWPELASCFVDPLTLGELLGSTCAAAFHNHLTIAELLLDHRADVNALNVKGESALSWAIGNGHLNMVLLLLKRGADVNIVETESGDSLVHRAIQNNNILMLQVLLDSGRLDQGLFRTPNLVGCV